MRGIIGGNETAVLHWEHKPFVFCSQKDNVEILICHSGKFSGKLIIFFKGATQVKTVNF